MIKLECDTNHPTDESGAGMPAAFRIQEVDESLVPIGEPIDTCKGCFNSFFSNVLNTTPPPRFVVIPAKALAVK